MWFDSKILTIAIALLIILIINELHRTIKQTYYVITSITNDLNLTEAVIMNSNYESIISPENITLNTVTTRIPTITPTQVFVYDKPIQNVVQTTSKPTVITNSPTIHFSSNNNIKCSYNFTVFVYDIPIDLPSVKLAREARENKTLHVCKKCILEQFALEYIIHDFFTQFCGRVYNPSLADYFYLPIIRDAEYRITLQGSIRNRASSNVELALLDVIEKNDSSKWKSVFNITDYYWHRSGGSDHIIVMPAPVTNLRHESSQRGFFHYMIHLNTPIFILVEYTTSFINEYPICSTLKNIIVPYPTTDPDLFNGNYHRVKLARYALLYYAGGMHGDCIEVRKAMSNIMKNSTKLNNHVVPKIKSNLAEREHGFLSSIFCPVPIGDSPSSKRMYDVINFGCIPVILSDDLVWAFSDQVNGPLNRSLFSIHIPQGIVQFPMEKLIARYQSNRRLFGALPSGRYLYDIMVASHKEDASYENDIYVNPLVRILRRIPAEDITTLQSTISLIASQYRYYELNDSISEIPTSFMLYPNGGSIKLLSEELAKRKTYGIIKLRDDCQTERKRKHQYVSRYPCEKDIRRRRLENSMYAYHCEVKQNANISRSYM